MKILFDHQTFEFQKYGGISKYFCELHKGINSISHCTSDFSVLYSDNIHLKAIRAEVQPTRSMYRKFRYVPFRGKIFKELSRFMPNLQYDAANKLHSSKILQHGDYDVFHPTYYDPYFLDNVSKPFVVTIHDLIHEYYPQYFENDTLIKKKLVIEKSSRIIAVSNYTKLKLCELYKVPDDKIDVVYHGINPIPDTDFKNDYWATSKPYILYVGTRNQYKNFYFYLLSVAELLVKYDVDLLAVGPPPSDYELMYVDFLGLGEKVSFLSSVNEAALNMYYKNSLFLAFPSLVEGFGMPILEAFNCGTAVMLSDISIFREIAGACGLFFDCQDQTSIRAITEYYLQHPSELYKFGQRGKEYVGKFSWHETAKQTVSVYEKCL